MKLVTSLQIKLITPNKNFCSQNMHLWRSKNRRCTIQVHRNVYFFLSFPTNTCTLSRMDGGGSASRRPNRVVPQLLNCKLVSQHIWNNAVPLVWIELHWVILPLGPDQKSRLLLIKRSELEILKQFGFQQCFLQVRFMRTITTTGNFNSKIH